MELELNKEYTGEELCKALGISRRKWYSIRDEIEEYLGNFFVWHINYHHKKICYIVTEILAPWEPMPQNAIAQKVDNFYTNETHKIIEEQNWNTGSNVARKIIKKHNRFNHTLDTAARYVRPILKRDYTRSLDVKWMRLDEKTDMYIELTDEQYEYLRQLWHSGVGDLKSSIPYLDYLEGHITKQEYCERMLEKEENRWGTIFKEFKEKFGFTPVYTHQYLEAAFEE